MKITGVFFVALAAVLSTQDVLSSTISLTEESLASELSYEIAKWMAAGLENQPHYERVASLTFSSKMRSTTDTPPITCTLCKSVVNVIRNYILDGMAEESIVNVVSNLCVGLNIQTEEVCRGIIELNAPIAFFIVENNPDLTPETVCGVILHKQSCVITDEAYEWSIQIDEGDRQYITSEKTEETVKIIHTSDFHYDPVYEPFGNAYCDAPTCCRKGQNETNTSGKVAGYWGDYHDCDGPWHAVENAIDQIKETEDDIAYIYYTGDIIDHGIWETSRAMIIESVTKTYTKLYETFGSTPVFAIIGNHESNPTNVFATPDVTDEEVYTTWLYELLADLWIGFGWLPESTRATILQGGFYTVSPKEGFRIIALNDNVCYTMNWWLLYRPQDPSGQLQWLADTLLQAEIDGEYVHILAHMPPGASSCQATWGREYRKIVDRFSHIISAEFNGHTHNDEFRVVYGLEDVTEPVRVTWVAGGVTTYSDVNPNYKVFTVNANTYVAEDYDNWMYNLTLANETPEQNPVWYKSYSFKEEYGLEDLSLSSLDGLIRRMAADSSILLTYYTHFVKQADALLANGCDESCRTNHLCKIVTAVAADSTQCSYFSNLN